tara:strand:+ start:568 stop:693 length:126 start_codon:yes stop_codon:yes gene_type:complete
MSGGAIKTKREKILLGDDSKQKREKGVEWDSVGEETDREDG